MKRSVAPLFVVLLIATATLCAAQSTAHGEATGGVSYNIAGPPSFHPGNDPVDLVVFAVAFASPRPRVVSLQEVCSNLQFWRIAGALQPHGYTGDFALAVAEPQDNCGQYGIALYLLGVSRGTAPPERIDYAYQVQDPPCNVFDGPECRKLLCRRMDVFFGSYVGCSTHLDNPSDLTTVAQRDEALFVTGINYGANQRIVGGDFNLNPLQVDNWINSHYEVDPQYRDTYSSTNPNRKVDFSFGDHAHFPSQRLTPAPNCQTSFSDHCYLSGYWAT